MSVQRNIEGVQFFKFLALLRWSCHLIQWRKVEEDIWLLLCY